MLEKHNINAAEVNLNTAEINQQIIKHCLYLKQYDALEKIATSTTDKKIQDTIYTILSNHSTREKNYQRSNDFIKQISDPQVSAYAIKFQVLFQLKNSNNKPSAEQIKEFIAKAEKLPSAYSDEIYYEIIQDSKDFELCSQLEDRIKGEEYKDKAIKRNVSYFTFNNLQRCMDLKEKYSSNPHHKDCVLSAIVSYHKENNNLQEAILEALQISSEELRNQLLGDIVHCFCLHPSKSPIDIKEKIQMLARLQDLVKNRITSHPIQSRAICNLLSAFHIWMDREQAQSGINKDLYQISKKLLLEIGETVNAFNLISAAYTEINGRMVPAIQGLQEKIQVTLEQSRTIEKVEANPLNSTSLRRL